MEDYTDDENLEQDIDTQDDSQSSSQPPRSFGGKVRKKGKEVAKKATDTFGQAIRNLWNKLPLKVRIIIAGIISAVIIVAILLLVILEFSIQASAATINDYMLSEDIANTDAGKFYQRTGSLLLMTDEQMKTIYDNYLKEIKEKTPVYYELMQEKPDYIVTDNSGVETKANAITLGEKLSIYEHILNAERYNFNRIIWKEYDRNSTTEKQIELEVDAETRLQHPKDSERDLEYFANITRPYLQSWVIPFSMMSGVATDTASGEVKNFAYEIISDAYHKIEIEKRNLESLETVSEYKEYDKTTYTVTITRTCSLVTTEAGTTEVCSDSAPVTTSTTEHIIEDEVETGRDIAYESVYNIQKLQLFDTEIEYTINVEAYDENQDPDREDKLSEDYYYAEEPKMPNVGSEAGVYTSSYELREGKKYKITRIWRDSVSSISTKENYTIDDIKQSSTGALSNDENKYYSILDSKGELNLIDIMNSNKENYKEYVKGVNFSENIGYTRDQLQVSYRLLKKYLAEIINTKGSGYAYGNSLGLNVSASGALLGDFSLEAVQNIDTNATYVAPLQVSGIHIQSNVVATGVYGYDGHTGIDIGYVGEHRDDSRCSDYNAYTCPYVAGPPVYSVQEGELHKVAYSGYNKYYGTGQMVTSDDGKLSGGGKSGSYVIIKHTSPTGIVTYSAYYHLFPDYNQLKELSGKVGQIIPAGTYLGHMGNTGNSTGLHLHFEYASVLWRIGNGDTSLAILRLAGL